MRSPSYDYKALYCSGSISDPYHYGQVYESGRPMTRSGRDDKPGWIYAIVPHRLPREAVIRRGSEAHEWVIVTCTGTVPFHAFYDWREVAAMVPIVKSTWGQRPEVTGVVITPLLKAFFNDIRTAPAAVVEAATFARDWRQPALDLARVNLPMTVAEYAFFIEGVASKFFCGVRGSPTHITRQDRLQDMACKAARKGKYTPRQHELWPPE